MNTRTKNIFDFRIHKKTALSLIPIFFLTVIVGSRLLGFDRDFEQYVEFYNEIGAGETSRFEFAFVLLGKLVQAFFGTGYSSLIQLDLSFNVFLYLVAFISISIKVYLLSKRSNYLTLMIIYILMLVPLQEMTQMRVGIATAIMFLGIYHSSIKDLKISQRLFYVILGLGFHQSTILLAPFILFSNQVKEFSLFKLLLGISLPALALYFVILLAQNFTETLYIIEYYTRPEIIELLNKPNPLSSRSLTLIAILSIGLLNSRNLPREATPWFYVSIVGLGTFFGMMSIPVMAHRFLEMTLFANLMWVSYLPRLDRYICISLLLLFAIYSIYRTLFLSTMFGTTFCAPACLYW